MDFRLAIFLSQNNETRAIVTSQTTSVNGDSTIFIKTLSFVPITRIATGYMSATLYVSLADVDFPVSGLTLKGLEDVFLRHFLGFTREQAMGGYTF